MTSLSFYPLPLMKQTRHFIVAALILLLAGCAGLDSQRMVPTFDEGPTSFQTGQSIRKIEIKGEKEEVFGGPAFAKKEQILDAARTTLRKSGIFNSVDEGKGNIDLYIIVRSQGQNTSLMLEYRAKITNTYRFVNIAGDVIWFKTYETEFSSHAFSGATRTVEAREGSVRENLAALIQGIEKSWTLK
jgi:hypothetical protein